ncbi:MAG: hypothetical protein U0835_26615 [Isosphaeraceae bacterium]
MPPLSATSPPACPYPRCPSRGALNRAAAVVPVAGDVRLCGACGGLVLACKALTCEKFETLNRPFARYCRRCGVDLAASGADAWDEAARSAWAGPLGEAGPPEDLADLSARAGKVADRTRVAMSMAQGVLALHEVRRGPGLLALLRPLAPEGADPWVWSAVDPVPAGKDEAPFDPALLPDGRHVVFSRPGRVVVLDLWGCTGISAYEEALPWALDLGEAPLASPPVALGDATFGLLRRAAAGSAWEVWRPGTGRGDAPAASVSLALAGQPCQVALVDGRVLTFATPEGHWVWSKADARAARADRDRLHRTWPQEGTPADARVHLDDHAGSAWSFHSPRQGFLVPRPGESPKFGWYYRVRDEPSGDEWVEQYFVDVSPLGASRTRRVRAGKATPVGATRGVSSVAEMLFRRGAELTRENNNGAIDPCHVRLPNPLTGLRLFDPLLAVIGLSGDDRRHLEIGSLAHQGQSAHVEFSHGIASDPLVWSRWLFTAEFDGQAALKVRRREIIRDQGGVHQ